MPERAPELGAAWLAAEMDEFVTARPKSAETKIDHLGAALTEQCNPRSENLEQMSTRELVELFVEEEKFVQEALRGAMVELMSAVELVAKSLRNGGRLFYVGAGTSGRLGVLDASEIPPTFGTEPDLVQGVIAGGATALYRTVEAAEDEENAGAVAISERGVKGGDIVLGISASGRTPFVLAALRRAKALGANTIFLACNSAPPAGHRIAAETAASTAEQAIAADPAASTVFDLTIHLAVGPEILTGSTRLKAGTATKVALNIISTGAMVLLGRVRGNLMIDLHTSSTKLRDRATRMIAELAQCDYEAARVKLEAGGWNVRAVADEIGRVR